MVRTRIDETARCSQEFSLIQAIGSDWARVPGRIRQQRRSKIRLCVSPKARAKTELRRDRRSYYAMKTKAAPAVRNQ